MKGEERRKFILTALSDKTPVAASALAERFGVSRQVIVQDIALIRSSGLEVISTPKGYLLPPGMAGHSRIFKVRHEDDRTQEELSLIINAGGYVENVFVHHRVYGTIEARLDVGTHTQIAEYVRSIMSGKSKLLKNVTDGYHYHTVSAQSEEVLDQIEQLLREQGFLIEK